MEAAFNETLGATLNYKSGNPGLYNLLKFGAALSSTAQRYSVGIGYGKDIPFSNLFSFNPEWSFHYIYQGNWSKVNLLQQLETSLAAKISKRLTLRTGPSFNVYYTNQFVPSANFGLLKAIKPAISSQKGAYGTRLSWSTGLAVSH